MVSGLPNKIVLGAIFLCYLFQIAVGPTDPSQNQSPRKPKSTKTTNGDQKRFDDVIQRSSSLFAQELQKLETLKKFFSVNFLDIPQSLKGLTDMQLQYYVTVLMNERRTIQRHMIYHMTQCWSVAVGSYFFSNPSIFPMIKMIGIDDEGQRKTLEEQWSKHQQRMADFVLQYLQVKKLKPESLQRNAVGIPYVIVTMGPNQFEQLPVYISNKGEQLPPFTLGITNSASRIMKTWWSASDKQQ